MQNFFLRLGPSGGHRVRAQRVPKIPCLLQRAACLRAVSRYASLIHCRYFDQIRAVRSREALFTALPKGSEVLEHDLENVIDKTVNQLW